MTQTWEVMFLQQDGCTLLRGRQDTVCISQHQSNPSSTLSETITVKIGREGCGYGWWRIRRTATSTSRRSSSPLDCEMGALDGCLLAKEGRRDDKSWVIEQQTVSSLSSWTRCGLVTLLLAGAQAAQFVSFAPSQQALLTVTSLMCAGVIVSLWVLSCSCAGIVGLATTCEVPLDGPTGKAGAVFETVSVRAGQNTQVRGRRKFCKTCQILRPLHASHCSVCNVCVNRFDHHCSITDTCVGGSNIGKFVTFLWLLTLYVMVSFAAAAGALLGYISNHSDGDAGRPGAEASLVAVAVAAAINIVPLAAGSALYVYLYVYLGGVSLWARKKKGGLYEGFEMEEDFSVIPKPFSHGTCSWKNLTWVLVGS